MSPERAIRKKNYIAWNTMVRRCHNPKASGFSRYGAKGITVCNRWRVHANFIEDMGFRPEGCSFDRKDNSKGYWCGKCEECVRLSRETNCEWSTFRQQVRNRSITPEIDMYGQLMSPSEIEEKFGTPRWLVLSRYNAGIRDAHQIISTDRLSLGRRVKITSKLENVIRFDFSEGMSLVELANKYGPCVSTISKIVKKGQ